MDYANIFKALGDETRLRILNLFLQSGERICVCEMVDALNLPQYTISKQLTILRYADLIKSGRQGTWVYNQLNQEPTGFLSGLFELLKKQLSGKYSDDIEQLNKRLALREKGICIVGVIPKEELEEAYRQ
ncbi:MAG: metalloregulator ArsR/SmtB family transcription factor [bacterium]|nr:metalloregulator ArsR/SmtB family transcription factor [bacterium]